MEQGRGVFKMLKSKLTGKRVLKRPRRRCEENIRMDLKEIVIYMRNCIYSAQHRD